MSFSKHQECDPQKEKLKRMITKRVLFISISIITAIILVGYSITVGASQLTAIEAYKVLILSLIHI